MLSQVSVKDRYILLDSSLQRDEKTVQLDP